MKNLKWSYFLMMLLALFVSGAFVQSATAQKKKPKITYYSIKTGTTFHV
ncbi:MAG: hypothetical protein H7070_00045, partial [Saprospiraceae bacterium]|nr:hypothetical protein [Pyrinomonadaceae bacterium]